MPPYLVIVETKGGASAVIAGLGVVKGKAQAHSKASSGVTKPSGEACVL